MNFFWKCFGEKPGWCKCRWRQELRRGYKRPPQFWCWCTCSLGWSEARWLHSKWIFHITLRAFFHSWEHKNKPWSYHKGKDWNENTNETIKRKYMDKVPVCRAQSVSLTPDRAFHYHKGPDRNTSVNVFLFRRNKRLNRDSIQAMETNRHLGLKRIMKTSKSFMHWESNNRQALLKVYRFEAFFLSYLNS